MGTWYVCYVYTWCIYGIYTYKHQQVSQVLLGKLMRNTCTTNQHTWIKHNANTSSIHSCSGRNTHCSQHDCQSGGRYVRHSDPYRYLYPNRWMCNAKTQIAAVMPWHTLTPPRVDQYGSTIFPPHDDEQSWQHAEEHEGQIDKDSARRCQRKDTKGPEAWEWSSIWSPHQNHSEFRKAMGTGVLRID